MMFALPILTLGLASLVSATLPALGGYNLAGLDFGIDTSGSVVGSAVPPPISQIQHFAAVGANLVRIPFGWQFIQPTLGGPLNAAFLKTLDTYVQAALATNAYVCLDLHNYARWNGKIIGVDGPTTAQFANLWSQLAKKYAGQPKIIFGLVNEPHDLSNFNAWVVAVQAAVNAIRGAGAKTQHILMPSNDWTHAPNIVSSSGPALLKVIDPAGGTDKLVFDVHQYLDSDGSGTHAECVTDNVALFTSLSTWLAANKRQALLSETGTGNNANCITLLKRQLSYVSTHTSTIAGFAYWAAGSFGTDYVLGIVPSSSGVDNALAQQAVFPFFPKKTSRRQIPKRQASDE